MTARWKDGLLRFARNDELVPRPKNLPCFRRARDLAPGETTRAQAGSWIPPPGDYDLELGVVQSGSGWFSDTAGRGTVRRRVTVTPPPP